MKSACVFDVVRAALALALAACGEANPTAGRKASPAWSPPRRRAPSRRAPSRRRPSPGRRSPPRGRALPLRRRGRWCSPSRIPGPRRATSHHHLVPRWDVCAVCLLLRWQCDHLRHLCPGGGRLRPHPHGQHGPGTAGSDVGEITLTPSGSGFAYSGGQLGATYDGAVFLPPQQ